jgi:hypothetical protein
MSGLDAIAAMRDVVVRGANADGGWPYYDGHSSRLEPTCWALLALAGANSSGNAAPAIDLAAHGRFLADAQRPDGLLLEPSLRAEGRPNSGFNGLAVLAMSAVPGLVSVSMLSSVVNGLLGAKGMQIPASEINRQDNQLQGWSWIDGTFSWVEPTTWCMIGLNKAPSPPAALRGRLEEGERLLVDRCCAQGGWNYGNSNMLGQDLRPYVPTTALGLMAMQRRASDAAVVRSLAWLKGHALAEQSAMALSLAHIALVVYDAAPDSMSEHLLAQWDRTAFLGNRHLTAMALYALTAGSQRGGAFRL